MNIFKEKLNSLPDMVKDTFELRITKEHLTWICTYDSDYSTLQEDGNKHNRCYFTDEDIEVVIDKTIVWLNTYVKNEEKD